MTYIGFRVELSNRIPITELLINQYNSSHTKTRIFNLVKDGKIAISRQDGILTAHGEQADKATGMINFSVMVECNDISRVSKIINVLGNDRLIRERVHTFFTNHSVLNSLPELQDLKTAFKDVDALVPGFIKSAYYYAPEMRTE